MSRSGPIAPRALLLSLLLVLLTGPALPSPAGDAAGHPPAPASSEFWSRWGDGQAEISGYRLVTPRYGETREGTAVLIYVTEDMDRRTWVKDDQGEVPDPFRVPVLKLNHVIKFRTGIYPYSIMTSVFAPVNGTSRERFAPAKISFSSQEWCGNVFQLLWPEADRFRSELHSYFSVEGDATETVETGPALYEDALPIQLRELDGPFAGGGDWSGALVPSLWGRRKGHAPLRPVPATIRRSRGVRDGIEVSRFVLGAGGRSRTFDVERGGGRRLLGWSDSDGETAVLRGTTRLPYWKLTAEGDESYLAAVGLDPGGSPAGSGEAQGDSEGP